MNRLTNQSVRFSATPYISINPFIAGKLPHSAAVINQAYRQALSEYQYVLEDVLPEDVDINFRYDSSGNMGINGYNRNDDAFDNEVLKFSIHSWPFETVGEFILRGITTALQTFSPHTKALLDLTEKESSQFVNQRATSPFLETLEATPNDPVIRLRSPRLQTEDGNYEIKIWQWSDQEKRFYRTTVRHTPKGKIELMATIKVSHPTQYYQSDGVIVDNQHGTIIQAPVLKEGQVLDGRTGKIHKPLRVFISERIASLTQYGRNLFSGFRKD